MDVDTFLKYYEEVHVTLVLAIPRLLNFTRGLSNAGRGISAGFVADMWFEDLDALKTALRSPEMREASADAVNLETPYTTYSGEVVSRRPWG